MPGAVWPLEGSSEIEPSEDGASPSNGPDGGLRPPAATLPLADGVGKYGATYAAPVGVCAPGSGSGARKRLHVAFHF